MMWKKRDWDAEKRGEGGETWRQFEGIMQKKKNIPVSFKKETCL